MPTIKGRKVTESQAAVYAVLRQYGPMPDHALVPLAQHALPVHQSSSGIRTRRKELLDAGLIYEDKAVVPTGSGRKAKVYKAVRRA